MKAPNTNFSICLHFEDSRLSKWAFSITVKPVLVAISTKRATCIKQACIQFPKQANILKCTCIKQAPVLSKQTLIIPWMLA